MTEDETFIVVRYWPRDKPIPDGWQLAHGILEDTHHGAHAVMITQVSDPIRSAQRFRKRLAKFLRGTS